MTKFTIEEICQATGGQSAGAPGRTFCGVCTDTRQVLPGNLFVALTGETFDGHNFLSAAAEKGAAGAVVSRRDIEAVPGLELIVVEDTLQALQALGRFHRQRFDIPVIAITGSNGKTTTKDMTAAVLSARFKVLKTQGNFNNEIGLPLTLLGLTAEHQAAVVEMGMRGLGQIQELAQIALPTLGIVTNVGETHIELLGSLENIAAAKGELPAALGAGQTVILNGDDKYVRTMPGVCRKVFYGIEEGSVRAEDIISGSDGTKFTCCTPKGKFALFVPAAGRHNVYNALAAAAAALELGLSQEEIRQGMNSFNASPMRFCRSERNGYTVINDAYNASPLSMNAAIDTLQQVAEGRLAVALGDMLELGDFGIEAHRQLGKKLAECGVSAVATVGELAAYIAETAKLQGISAVKACRTHEEAAEFLRSVLLPGDTLLIKGSRGMKMETILDVL